MAADNADAARPVSGRRAAVLAVLAPLAPMRAALNRPWLRVSLIAAIVLLTAAVDQALPHFGASRPFAPLYFSALVVASIGHTREALAAVLSMALLAAYWLPPDGSLAVDKAEDLASELVYILVSSLLAFVIPSLRAARQRAERAYAALRHQALYDALTGLPNRALLTDRIAQAILAAQRTQTPLALLLLDMDRFKEVNDTFGHHRGDLLLQQMAQRLGSALPSSDTVARLGGDEFAVLLPGSDAAGAILAAATIGRALEEPFVVEAQPLHMKASIGIALYPAHGLDAQALLRRADVAMYVAKRGGEEYALYAPEQDAHSRERIALVTELRRACAARQIELHYQPIVEMATGRLAHVEALARWTHPERGPVRPDVFIPLAEEMGLIGLVTECVLHEALAQYQQWRRRGLVLSLAVNLSMLNLRDPRLAEMILDLLRRYEAPATALRLELTETSIMSDQAQTAAVLATLGAAGVHISVDDFGIGYSSLAYLKRLPVDEIKIDRSFVMDMAHDEVDATIVRSTISMAQALGLRVVAEGVETRHAWEMLQRLACDAAQGHYVSRPLTATELEDWLHEGRGT